MKMKVNLKLERNVRKLINDTFVIARSLIITETLVKT